MTDEHGHDELEGDLPGERAPRKPGLAKRALSRLDKLMKREERRKGGWFGRLVMWGFLLVIVFPVLWVLAYRFIEAPGTILMVQRSMAGETIQREAVKLDQISPHLVRAVIAAEDAKFCTHDGFDREAISKAMAANAKSKKVRGGSTISQQTAKNMFLWPQRDWIRKGLETYFTGMIDMAHFWPKKRIMEAYLNAAEWGDGVFGAEAAAQARFGVSAKDLSPRQAALLAAVLPSPNKWSADKPGPYVRRRAASIEARMWGVRAQGLDLCVLDPGAAPPPRKGPVEDTLPPMVELPPEIAAIETGDAQPATEIRSVNDLGVEGGEPPAVAGPLEGEGAIVTPEEPASEQPPTEAPADAPSEGPVNIAPTP